MFSKINSIYLRGMEGKERDRGGGRQRRTSGADPRGIPGLRGPGGRRPGADGDQESRTIPAAQRRSRSTCPRQISERKGPASTSRSPRPSCPPTEDSGRKDLEDAVFFGELGLDGTVRGIPGRYGAHGTRHGRADSDGYFLPAGEREGGIRYRRNCELYGDPGSETSPGGACPESGRYAGGAAGKHGRICRIP